jgi:DNA polymerase III delta prime subunit
VSEQTIAQNVTGDKNIFTAIGDVHVYNPPPSLPPAEAKERRELGILLGKVKQFWIEGVLEKSIHTIAMIDLGKETQVEAVAHPWEQVLELPDQSRQTLPPDKKISHIFDEMNRALLILGAPGSGKTITLLQLARDLITQVERDESFSQSVPVVFNLPTWTKGQLLVDWLVAELSAKYQIPKRVGRPWLENHRLLPLLDGLDEVKFADRADCVEAINHFGTQFGLSGLVVCSRLEEYTTLPVRLKLNGAICLKPLTLEQIYDYLDAAGFKLDVLRTILQQDEGLRDLAKSPLILGIMCLTYQDISVETLSAHSLDTVEARREQLFDTYISRMFKRKGQRHRLFTNEETKNWLSWLAQQMSRHNQAIFLLEDLQPDWVSTQIWRWAYVLGSRLMTGLFFGLIFGISNELGHGGLLGATVISKPGDALIVGLSCGLIFGLIFGISDIVRFERNKENEAFGESPTRGQSVTNILTFGTILGLSMGSSFGLIFGLNINIISSAIIGLIVGLVWGIILELRGSRQRLSNDIRTVEALSWSWRKASIGGIWGWVIGAGIGLINRLRMGVISGLHEELIAGLFNGLGAGVIVAAFSGFRSKIVEMKTKPNQGIELSARNALFVGLVVGLVSGLGAGLTYGLRFGLNLGLVFGLSVGLFCGLFAFLLYGGLEVIQHYTLRFVLWYKGYMPRNYAHFLDYAVEHIFLQKVGGGYIFIHRLLLEHFAAMEEPMEK